MQLSPTTSALFAAFSAAQGAFTVARMDRANPFFKSRYATLQSVFEATRAALAANGLCVAQEASMDGEEAVVIETVLAHSSGEWLRTVSRSPLTPLQKQGGGFAERLTPQAAGSAITYAKRYALMALLGISQGEEDDDAHAASNPPQRAVQRPAAAPTAHEPAELSQAAQGALAGINGAVDAAALGEVAKSFATLSISDAEKAFLRDAYRTRLGVIRSAK